MWLATLACSIILFWNEKQLAHKNLKEFRQNEQQQQQQEYDEEQATEPLHSPADKHEIPAPAMSNIPIDSVQQPLYAPSTSPPPPPIAAHSGGVGYYHHTPEPPMTSFTPEPPFIPPQPTASATPAFNTMPQPYYHPQQQPYP